MRVVTDKETDTVLDSNKLDAAVDRCKERLDRCLPHGLDRCDRLAAVAFALWDRFETAGGIDDIKTAITYQRQAVKLCPLWNSRHATFVGNLGIMLWAQFKQLGQIEDINESIECHRKLLHFMPRSHANHSASLSNLGNSLCCRFERLGDLSDINKSVSMFEDAVQLTPDGHPGKPFRLNNLGISLLRRFSRLGGLSDLSKAVLMLEDAVQLTPDGHPDKPSLLNNLGISLLRRFSRLGDLSDLSEAVLMLEDAVQLTPDGHPGKPSLLNSLGGSLLGRFEWLGDLSDIGNSVLMIEAAVQLTPDGHPDKPSRLYCLGSSLLGRFMRLGDLSDINKSILMLEDAVQLTPDGHPSMPFIFYNLGRSLFRRFERLGDLSDINKSVSVFENAVQLTPDGHPGKPHRLYNLGSSLGCRFEGLGDLSDINKSVSMFEDAVQLTPDGHPDKPSMLINLGNSLFRRFEWLGDLSDINKSVLLLEDAVQLIPDGHSDKPFMLYNLGNSLSRRFQRLGDLSDINKCVSTLEDAVQLAPDGHPYRPCGLNNLGVSLGCRFERLGDLRDINKSVLMLEDAVQLSPDGHRDKPCLLNTLGGSLLYRFCQLGDLSDINKSVLMLEDAVQLTPDGHPDKPSRLYCLGNSLWGRFEQLGTHEDLLQGISQYSLASQSTTGPAHIRFQASLMWGHLAQIDQHSSLLQAYMVALDLLPQLAWLGLSIGDRHHYILEAGKVVRDAAAAAIVAGQYKQAVEWLEQGRSIIWGQLLQLRTPIDNLQQHHPDLADRLRFLSAQLEQSGTRDSSTGLTGAKTQASLSSMAQQCHEYAHERDKLLKKIRELEGFDRFLLPMTLSQLLPAAQTGPVVVLNICETRCDALVLKPGLGEENIIHVPLVDFTLHDAQSLHKSLSCLTGAGRNLSFDSDRLNGYHEGHVPPEEVFADILSTLWLKVVKPVLDALAITNLQRVWWCPTGPLAFLPLHAAGLYEADQTFGSKLSDFVISSYTPSLTALITGLQAHSASERNQAFQLLTVSQPSAIGQSYLPGTQKEINRIQLHAGKHPVLQMEGNTATVDSVQKSMKECSWVHFACHGIQDVSNPTESALLLAGSSRLKLLSIIKLSIPHADFAFLSACQTATGDKELQEESVHLAAGMLSAGYRSVIATMWSIMDSDAPQIASDVYEHLFGGSPLDSTRAAEALHLAVRKLQEEAGGKKPFLHWVPYIHIGV
ncbi:TPR-like protein [Mycena galericulata]|nr:TPR-like protein [Mycena galericulata]